MHRERERTHLTYVYARTHAHIHSNLQCNKFFNACAIKLRIYKNALHLCHKKKYRKNI